MATFHLEIITPIALIDMGQVDYVRAPSQDGLFGVKAGHTDAIIALQTGEVKVVKDGKETFFATSVGYAEITHKHVQLLVETAEDKATIDVKRAEAAMQRAKERLSSSDVVDEDRAMQALARAFNRLRVARR